MSASDQEAEALRRLAGQVLEELNVKRLELLPAESDMLLYTLKPRMKALGPKHGTLWRRRCWRRCAPSIRRWAREALRDQGQLVIEVEGQPVTLLPEEVEVEASAREGYVAAEERGDGRGARDDADAGTAGRGAGARPHPPDPGGAQARRSGHRGHIETWLTTDANLAATVVEFRSYIEAETLSKRLVVQSEGPSLAPSGDGVYTEEIPAAKLNGHAATVTVRKAR